MDMSKHVGPKYLGSADYPRPAVLTMMQVAEEPIGPEQEIKVVVWFENVEKAMVLNRTNISMLVELFGTESDEWLGHKIEVYTDPNVNFAGKRIPALRLRAPQQQPRPTPPRAGQPPQVPPAPRVNVPRSPAATEGLVYDEPVADPA